MVTAITQDVKISVDTTYQDEFSIPENAHFMFGYRITIENLGHHAVQLLRRKWYIFDVSGYCRIVEGDGVVGSQPILQPGETYIYDSGCNLKSEIGSMKGHYEMIRLVDEEIFQVEIPEFKLIVPYKLN